MKLYVVTVFLLITIMTPLRHVSAQDSMAPIEKPFIYEFYYKVKWGYFDEFLALYKKNHFPVLKKQRERGEILSIKAAFPINHAGEDKRWDMRVTIVYRDAIIAHEDPSEADWVKALFPNQEKFKKEEQHRFELLIEHMDVPILEENVDTW
jgi:hypothetical protein